MNDSIRFIYNQSLDFLCAAVNDLSPEMMTTQPGGMRNHPAWTLGHCIWTGNIALDMLGFSAELPPNWTSLYAMGSTPIDAPLEYAGREELTALLKAQHERLSESALHLTPERLRSPLPQEDLRVYFPTLGDFILSVMTHHEGCHCGQLAVWRQLMGLPAVF